MASNQSRPRSGPGQASNIDIPPLRKSIEEFQYRPLDSKNCIRLIEFEIAENASNPPRCKLIHATFGETPEYEALSYRWGDETFKTEILVDGKRLLVGQNLWDALHCLRKRANGRRYWIDAICINQADIPERNQQVRIMPHIYFRAHTVVVWLGRYAKFNAGFWDDMRVEEAIRAEGKARVNSVRTMADCTFSASELKANAKEDWIEVELANNLEIELKLLARELHCLCTDDYWGRVWIVQEIGKVQKILVCFGEQEMAWDAFIEKIESYAPQTAKEGIMKLDRQRRMQYDGKHTLRELLQNHQHAVCQDPRDKIYGFVGLAVDASNFPMDYQKSPFEVWKDTMLFANKHWMLPGSDIVPSGNSTLNL
jgi:hypothetical protein